MRSLILLSIGLIGVCIFVLSTMASIYTMRERIERLESLIFCEVDNVR